VQYIHTAFRGTPFHRNTTAACSTPSWFAWGEYVVPDVYSNVNAELFAIRNNVSMNEMSPLPKFDVVGPDAERLIDLVITRDVRRLPVGHVWYTPFCDDSGMLVADGLVFRLAEEHFRLTTDYLLAWLTRWGEGLRVEIREVTHDFGILALQGPKSTAVMADVTGEMWSDLAFSRIRYTKIAGVDLYVARQGFTGERGYELHVRREDGYAVWEAIHTAGLPHGIRPAGEYAIDIARVEAGLIVVSADYTPAGTDQRGAHSLVDPTFQVSPFEIGLGRLVDFKKNEYVGMRALQEMATTKAVRRLVGIELDWQKIAAGYAQQGLAPTISPRVRWDTMPIRSSGATVGRLSSATWSPTTNRMIGFGLLNVAATGSPLEVEWCGESNEMIGAVPAIVVEIPFVAHRRSRPDSKR
jgi:aminomethyltransferase